MRNILPLLMCLALVQFAKAEDGVKVRKASDGSALPALIGEPFETTIPGIPINLGVKPEDAMAKAEIVSLARASSMLLKRSESVETITDGARVAHFAHTPWKINLRSSSSGVIGPDDNSIQAGTMANWVIVPYEWWLIPSSGATMVGIDLLDGYVSRACFYFHNITPDDVTAIVKPLQKFAVANSERSLGEYPAAAAKSQLTGKQITIQLSRESMPINITIWRPVNVKKGPRADTCLTIEFEPVALYVARKLPSKEIATAIQAGEVISGMTVSEAALASRDYAFDRDRPYFVRYAWSKKWNEYRVVLKAELKNERVSKVTKWLPDDPDSPRWAI